MWAVGAFVAEIRHGRGARLSALKIESKDLRNRQKVKCRVGCHNEMCRQWAHPKWLGREERPDSRQKNFNWVERRNRQVWEDSHWQNLETWVDGSKIHS